MEPSHSPRSSLPTYLAAWLPVPLLLAALWVRGAELSWSSAIVLALPPALLYALVCRAGYYLCRAMPWRLPQIPRLVAAQALAAAASAAAWVWSVRLWATAVDSLRLLPPAAAASARLSLVIFGLGVLLYLLASAVHYVQLGHEASRAAERRSLELQVLTRDAELETLRAQIHPHFLFNALNSISALTTRDPAGARRVCQELAEFLRRSLSLGAAELIPLSEELALAEHLLRVEQVRFGERLQVALEVPPETRPARVPGLILQPLVENAVTHGIAGLVEGGRIRLAARRTPGRLELTVENPRDPEAGPRRGAGVGLEHVRRRLAALYGEQASLAVESEARRFSVRLSLPWREGVSAPGP